MKNSTTIYASNPTHYDLVDNVIEKTKETLFINENEQTPLWREVR